MRIAILFLWIGSISISLTDLTEAAKICRSTSIPFHTWVQMDYSCTQAGNCGSKPPFTQWRDIGYENGNGGMLRDESKNPGGVYKCTSWFVGELQGKVASAASAQQERSAIAALVDAEWSTAQYGLIAGGLTSVTCNPATASWYPRSGKANVCWTFTCAYSSYLYQILKIRSADSTSTSTNIGLKAQPEIPAEWSCSSSRYGSGDGCQCTCGAFDPDCAPYEAVSLDCPRRDDVCIPGPLNQPVCALRHEVLSDRKLIQIHSGVAVHHPQFYFSNEANVDGAPWGNYSQPYIRSVVPTTWKCNPLFYGSNDGCDCECGAWDPDCDTAPTTQKQPQQTQPQRVFNCNTDSNEVRCAMSISVTTPAEPVCLYDRMAAVAAAEAGYPALDGTSPTVSPVTVIAASVGGALGGVAFTSAVAYFIIRHQRAQRVNRDDEMLEIELQPRNVS